MARYVSRVSKADDDPHMHIEWWSNVRWHSLGMGVRQLDFESTEIKGSHDSHGKESDGFVLKKGRVVIFL
jgi:hypothetical protein